MNDASHDNNSSREGSPAPLKSKISELRACDNCRVRKIRCDRKKPCAHCRSAGLACRTTAERPEEQRARVTISKQYESKIDRIENRLASIEQLLRRSNNSASSPSRPTPTSIVSSDSHNDHLCYEDDSSIHVPGSTGAHADSLAAKDVLEHTLNGDVSISRDPQLGAALASLQNMVKMIRTGPEKLPTVAGSTTLKPPGPPDHYHMPLWGAIKSMLDRFDEKPPPTFPYYLPSRSFKEFYQACYAYYEAGKPRSQAQRIIVYMGLHCLYADLGLEAEGEESSKYNGCALAFQHEILQSLYSWPLVTPATMDTVEALMAGTFVAIDACKPSLCWTLSSASIRLCQTMGYNRSSSMVHDSESVRNKKRVLFWMAYITDRSSGLRLGRSPAIQDFDITVSRPEPNDYLPESVITEFHAWIDFARIQGQINDNLYGPAGLSASQEYRSKLAQRYAEELGHMWRNKQQASRLVMANMGPMIEPIVTADTVQYYSTLTLALHAAAKPHEVSTATLEAARNCLRESTKMSHKVATDYYSWSMWCHWVLLQTPLTPLTVMFSHIISNYSSSSDDLQLLQDFVKTLEYGSSVSEGTEKYHRMCSILAEVASAYVNAKRKEAHGRQHNQHFQATADAPGAVTDYFDQRLSQMGFPLPFPDWPQQGGNATTTDYLSDWYSANTMLYGILEQDLNNFGEMDFGDLDPGEI